MMKIRNQKMLNEVKSSAFLFTVELIFIGIIGLILMFSNEFYINNPITTLLFWLAYFVILLIIWIHYIYVKIKFNKEYKS